MTFNEEEFDKYQIQQLQNPSISNFIKIER